MSEQSSKFPHRPSSPQRVSHSVMNRPQLTDLLTSHISLYHSRSLPPNSNPNPRSFILKWFSSLTVHQRQAHLTVLDSKFVQILVQMLGKLRIHGHGSFIILPDLPSRDLPSLCYKKSRGLLSRVAESNESERWIFESVRLFASREGEKIDECSCSVMSLDTVTVTVGFVENVDLFVESMDKISNGEFLRGEGSDLGSDWVELEWLKSKGFYSMAAFLANRLDVAMRLAWMNSNSGKKRGVKLKEKLNGAVLAANIYWRKKGCVDWWRNLDAAMRKKALTTIMGKAAKSLTREILKGASSATEDEIWLFNAGVEQSFPYSFAKLNPRKFPVFAADAEFGTVVGPISLSRKPDTCSSVLNCLFVLRDIITMVSLFQNSKYDVGNLFFSTLDSFCTISDCILRKLRGFLLVISLDYTKAELLGEGNHKCGPNKSKEKTSNSSRKKKGRNHNIKRVNPVLKSCLDDISCKKSIKDNGCALANKGKSNAVKFKPLLGVPPGKGSCGGDLQLAVEMEHIQELDVGKVSNSTRRSKKEKNKSKNVTVNNQFGESVLVKDASSVSAISEGEVLTSDRVSNNSTVQNITNDSSISNDTLAPSPRGSSSLNGSNREDNSTQSVQGVNNKASTEHRNNLGPECCVLSNGNNNSSSKLDASYDSMDCVAKSPPVSALELGNILSNSKKQLNDLPCFNQPDVKSSFQDKLTREGNGKGKPVLFKGEEGGHRYDSGYRASAKCSLYEFPGVASIYFPSFNSHLPAATDRLHLDVGRNWHNHFCHSFVPTLQQGRTSLVEGGGNQFLSQPLPMSLDWPHVVRGCTAPSMTCNYDSGFISRRQSAFSKGLAACSQLNASTPDDERTYSGDLAGLPDWSLSRELADDCDNHWVSEEEFELHAVPGIDYNQYFGGGIMYWNSSDHPRTGFSRPPSLSSDDSVWAWREADMSRAVDDMVAFSSSYSTNGLTSPSAGSFCSPFDSLGPGHQTLGYVMSSNEVPGEVLHSASTVPGPVADEDTTGSLANNLTSEGDGKASDSHAYPILRPIIIPNLSRERSRSEFKRACDHKSPCVPPTRQEERIKRPPSPVVLSVPRAPRPPPPSPVSDSRKQRGFPTVRSGSSSPRNWGMRGWFHDGSNFEEACARVDSAEVVWPSWRNKSLAARPMIQPLPAALLQDRLIAMSQLVHDQEHPDVAIPLQPPEVQSCPTYGASISAMHSLLHDEIDSFCKQVAAENMARKPYINWAVKRVTRSLQVLWPRSRTNIFGSNATGLSLPSSDVDLVVCLPPVRNLEPIKEAGILEGRNGIKETCLQHAARYLANQDWVKSDSLKTVENTAIPIIMLVVEVPHDVITSSACNIQSPKEEPTCAAPELGMHSYHETVQLGDSSFPKCQHINLDKTKDSKSVRLDISFKSPSHTGLQTTQLVKDLTEQFPAATPLALVLKQFLADRSLDQSYSGGLSSYCLVILIIRFLQHEHHLGRPINQNFGSLLMDFLYFFGNVFDPRQMRVSVQGSGVYINRERGCSIDPIHIDDPLFPTNNVGRNCFRIHQCIKAFSEAYSILENELTFLNSCDESCSKPPCRLLQNIIPSINL